MKNFSFVSWMMVTTYLLGASAGYAMNVDEDTAESRHPFRSASHSASVEEESIEYILNDKVDRRDGGDKGAYLYLDFKKKSYSDFDNLKEKISKSQISSICVVKCVDVESLLNILSPLKKISFHDCDLTVNKPGTPWPVLLRQKHSETLKELSLVGSPIDKPTLSYLFCGSTCPPLKLSDLSLSNAQIKEFAYVKKQKSGCLPFACLKKQKSNWPYFIRTILGSQSLEGLDLSNNDLEDADMTKFVSHLNSEEVPLAAASTLTGLVLCGNLLTDNSGGNLRILLREFPKLRGSNFYLNNVAF